MKLNQTKVELVKTSITNVQSQETKIDRPLLSNKELLSSMVLLVMFLIAKTLCLFTIKHIYKQRFSFKSHYKINCRSCRFFSSNSYLHCAVHPVTVLTEKAVDCSDYRSNKRLYILDNK